MIASVVAVQMRDVLVDIPDRRQRQRAGAEERADDKLAGIVIVDVCHRATCHEARTAPAGVPR